MSEGPCEDRTQATWRSPVWWYKCLRRSEEGPFGAEISVYEEKAPGAMLLTFFVTSLALLVWKNYKVELACATLESARNEVNHRSDRKVYHITEQFLYRRVSTTGELNNTSTSLSLLGNLVIAQEDHLQRKLGIRGGGYSWIQ